MTQTVSMIGKNKVLPAGTVTVRSTLALPKVPANDGLAAPYGLAGSNLPGLGLGVNAGAHVYPLHWKSVTFGLGVNAVIGRSHTTADVLQPDGTTVGTPVTARFTALAPQVSFNFGSAAGWSYLSGGYGSGQLAIDTPAAAGTAHPWRRTIDYGGGGRWFVRDRMAISFDIRFYKIDAAAASENVKPSPRVTMLVVSVGISVR